MMARQSGPMLPLLALLSGCLLASGLLSSCAHVAPVPIPAPEVPEPGANDLTTKGFEDARSTRAQLEANSAPRRWAVVIGVNHFDDPTYQQLRYADADARDMAWALKSPRFGNFDRVISLMGPDQTSRSNILTELSRLRNDLRRQDTLLVYFSGHGSMEFSADGHPLLYLITKDTRAADLWGTSIELTQLRAFLADLKPQRKVLILDSCFSGSGKSRISATTREHLESSNNVWDSLAMTMGQSEAVLMASTLGGVALESESLRHATYTHFLLKALTDERERADSNHDGAVTAYEAHDYARAHTLDFSKKGQIPEGYFRVIGRADMFLSGTPLPDASRDAALVYAYGNERKSGVRMEVDGRSKGEFPGTISVEPGERRITLTDERGRVVADNTLELSRGQSWSLGMLLEALQGYRRYFGLNLGGFIQSTGDADQLWGAGAPRLEVDSGYRMRGGPLRGLSLAMNLGYSPSWPSSAEVPGLEGPRHMLNLGVTTMLRRNVGHAQLGLGWHGEMLYVSGVSDGLASRLSGTTTSSLTPLPANAQPWLLLPGGPVLWYGIPLHKDLLLTLEARGNMVSGDYSRTGEASFNFVPSVLTGIELGF